MGEWIEQTVLKKESKNAKKYTKKVFNILSHQGNANQNYIEISFHPCHSGYHQENKQQMLPRMGVGMERNPHSL
jgi:hypothetical protein